MINEGPLDKFVRRLGDLSLRTFPVQKYANNQYTNYKNIDLLGAIRCVILNKKWTCEEDLYLEIIEQTGNTRIGKIITIKDQEGISETFIINDSETHWFITEITGALSKAPKVELSGIVEAKYR